MTFLYPSFLFGLLALAIPIIIHLFNFKRYKKVEFSNVKFLQEIKERTQAQSQLKHILILISRLLAITFLILAFAQPILKIDSVKAITGNTSVSIFIDNSFSMNGVGTEGNLLEIARQYAYKIVDACKQTDDFQVLDHNFSPEGQRLYSKESIVSSIDNIQISPSSKSFNETLKRQQNSLEKSNNTNKALYLLSDGQETFFKDLETVENDSTPINLIITKPEVNSNILIDSCWFESPVRSLGQPEELKVRLKNLGDDSRTGVAVKLFINETQKNLINIDIPAKGEVIETIGFSINSAGNVFGRIAIQDYPITFDDDFHFYYRIKPSINIGIISKNDTSKAFRSLFKTDSYFKLKQYTQGSIDFTFLKEVDLFILNGLSELPSSLSIEIEQLLNDGKNICFIPNGEVNKIDAQIISSIQLTAFQNQIKQKARVSDIQFNHPLFENVFEKEQENIDLPAVSKYFPLNSSALGFEPIMELDNGNPFLIEKPINKGSVYAFTAALNDSSTNFLRHALFVPTFFQMALKSGVGEQLYYTLGKNESIDFATQAVSNEDVFHIKNKELDIIPEVQRTQKGVLLKFYDQIKSSGGYTISIGEKDAGGIAFNFNRKESSNRFLSAEEIKNLMNVKGYKSVEIIEEDLNEVSKSLTQEAKRTKLWQLFLLLALGMIGIEMLLLRFLK